MTRMVVGVDAPPVLGLNAPYGARCFLTTSGLPTTEITWESLNAPYGARCFLTRMVDELEAMAITVLMHLMALGAF